MSASHVPRNACNLQTLQNVAASGLLSEKASAVGEHGRIKYLIVVCENSRAPPPRPSKFRRHRKTPASTMRPRAWQLDPLTGPEALCCQVQNRFGRKDT